MGSIDKKLQQLLNEKVLIIKADYAEIRAELIASTSVVFRGPDPELISQPETLGFFVRVLVNGSWGVATFTDIEQLDQKIDQALTFAKLSNGNVTLANTPVITDEVIPKFPDDFREVPLSQKVDLVKSYNQIILETPGIETTTIVYNDLYIVKYFVNSKGSQIYQARPYIRLSVEAVAKNKGEIESSRETVGAQGGYGVVLDHESLMKKVAGNAIDLARAPKVKAGIYTVILDPAIAGTFAHEAFGHFSEADHQYENPDLLRQMEIGKKLGTDVVSISDDPNLESGWGNFLYDDEGVKAERVELLKNGVIAGRLHSLETAGALKEAVNGRARADGSSSPPLVRMSNTFFEKGTSDLEEMIKSTNKGILAVDWLAGMTALESFTFTAAYGVMIENGKLTNKVKGVKLMGNIFETLKNIESVSSDFVLDQGFCGKGGQRMPVGSGGAYVKIKDMTIGGE